QKRVNPQTGEEVPYEQIVKGYEISPDQYVVITPDELEALDPEKTRTIDIEGFVDLEEIDPIYFDHPYYLVPDTGADKAYNLLREAMDKAGKVAIARVVIRSKESLVAIRPAGSVLQMSTMLFHDEVVPPESIGELPDTKAKDAKANKRELEMAEQLIASLSEDFEPEKYRDEYRDRVLDLIERKAEGQEIAIQPPAEAPTKVPDLMAALEQSINAAKQTDGGDGAAKPRGRSRAKSSANGAGKGAKSGGAKRAAPKAKAKTKK
ncbi:MAG: end-binding protein Ku, partial [Solirubrobacteraceae bacterium]|nr:end-binding protein Ku [Solirubrobacteraceae bacterium]